MKAIGNTVLLRAWAPVCAVQCGGWVWSMIRGVGTKWPGYLAIVMLGTPTRGTSLTVIWNKRYSI
ncbi:MAG: hypothetical protein JW395_4012 [Nitrospira sp.]|nr:hypothetical protein [Nitrospira sp.]